MIASLARCSFLKGSVVYVDGFADFTEYERRILVGIASAGARMEVMLLIDPASPTVRDPHLLPDEMGLFYRTEMTYRRLRFAFAEGGVAIKGPILLRQPRRFLSGSLEVIERSLFDTTTTRPQNAGGPPVPRESLLFDAVPAPPARVTTRTGRGAQPSGRGGGCGTSDPGTGRGGNALARDRRARPLAQPLPRLDRRGI